jgi:hypothetical protein
LARNLVSPCLGHEPKARVATSIVVVSNCIFPWFLNFDYKVWVHDFKVQLDVFMAPSLSETSPSRQGLNVEYVRRGQLELEA